MAHFAELNENNIVIRVLVVPNEVEHRGEEYLAVDMGLGGKWIQTSYNARIRGKYAGPGDVYDPELDMFFMPEHGIADHLKIWNGSTKPQSPSVMIDSLARSGNIFFGTLLKHGIPEIFQRWGYQFQHNPLSFRSALNDFDLILAPLRNPLDSAASWIQMTGIKENIEAITIWLEDARLMFDEMLLSRDIIKFIKFEDFILDTQNAVNKVAGLLGVNSIQININDIESELTSMNQLYDNFYSMPIDNKNKIEEIKSLLSANFAGDIEYLQGIYEELVLDVL